MTYLKLMQALEGLAKAKSVDLGTNGKDRDAFTNTANNFSLSGSRQGRWTSLRRTSSCPRWPKASSGRRTSSRLPRFKGDPIFGSVAAYTFGGVAAVTEPGRLGWWRPSRGEEAAEARFGVPELVKGKPKKG